MLPMRSLPSEALATLRERVGEAIDVEVRDSLRVAVHGKACRARGEASLGRSSANVRCPISAAPAS